MRYDLDLICQLCNEVGLSVRMKADQCVQLDLGQGAVLFFQNSEREEDCLVGFFGSAWHAHGDLMFADARGNYVEVNYLDLLIGLKEGRILVCEQEVNGRTVDRWLIHDEYNNEYKDLQAGERIIVRRAIMQQAEASQT